MSQNSDTGALQGPPPPTLPALQAELAETRRRLAEAEQIVASLPENERFFRALFEQSVVGMARVSATTGRFVRVNIALCHLVGYSMDELEQMAPGDITFADDREAHAEAVAAMRRGDTDAYDLQKRYVHKDGNLIWVHVRAALVRDAQGNPEATFSTIEDITASRAAGAALRASEARFRASFENSSLAMSILSQDKVVYQDVNKVCTELFGLTREAMLGRSPAELGLYADPDATQKTLRSLLQQDGFVRDHEVLWRAKDGELRWHLLSADPIVMEGEPCMFVVSHDITARKEAEALLREKDAFNLAALEASPDCLKVVDVDGRIEYINGNGVCLLELDDCAAVLGEKWETLWPASEHPTIRTAIATALAGEAANFAATGPTAKGTPKVWDVSVAPVPAIDGPPTKLIVASRDVTDMADNMERLRASEARYMAAIKAVDGTVWTNNAIGEMSGDQPGWSALTGQTYAEYQGFGWARAVHPDDAQLTIDAWNAAVATSSLFAFEHRVRRHDGEWRHFKIRAAPILDQEGNVAEWVGMHRDITDRKEAAEALLENDALLQQALSAAGAGIWTSNLQNSAFAATDRALELYGLEPGAEITHELALEAVYPEDRPQVCAALNDAHETGLPFQMEMRSRNSDGTIRWLLSQAEKRETGWLVGLVQDISERKNAENAILESETRMQLATQTAGIGLWHWNVRTGHIRWDRTMFEMYGMKPTADGSLQYIDWIGCVLSEDAAKQEAILQDTASSCGHSEREFRIQRRDDGRVRHIRAVETARAGPDGKTDWVVGTNLDITEQVANEAHNQLLMGEVNHRSKNLLGVVMAVARQTGGDDHAAFMRSFGDRIQSLAAGQDLLVHCQWQGVMLEDLVRAQLSHFSELIGGRITLDGGAVRVTAAAAQTIGMALHELATNASKYGALSADRGRIAIAWHLGDGIGLDRRFVMTWTESDGPPVVVPKRTGFGSTVIGRMAKMSLDCETSADFLPSGFSWRMDCPAEKIIDESLADRLMNRELA